MRGGVHWFRERRLRGEMDRQSRSGKKRGKKFLQYDAVDSDGGRNSDPLLCPDAAEQHDAAKAHQMLQYFGNRGYFCLFQPIIIAVDACVKGAEGNRVGEQAQKL